MAGILEYSSDRTSNTTINGIGITGSDSVKQGNDAIQQLMADLRTAVTKITDKGAGSYTAVKADHNQCWRVTGTATINLTAAATLTNGWCLWVLADGGTVTIDPASSEQINSAATLQLVDGSAALIIGTGTAFRALIFNAPFDFDTLGGAAFLDVGTTAGTVAAGNDSRIAGAVQKALDTALSAGYTATSKDLGDLGSAVTISPSDGNIQHGTNTEAVTITAPSVEGVYTIIVELVNSATAGAVTLAGFTKTDGDAFTTTNGHKFQLHIAKTNSAVTATVKALQ